MTTTATATMGMVALKVADIARVSTFYQQALGLQVHRTDTDGTVYLGAGGADLLALIPRPDGKRYRGVTGLYHFALLVPTRRDLALVLKHFAQTQTPLQGLSDHFVSEAIYLSDPEGNGIEIYADRPRDKWYNNGQFNMGTVALDIDDLLEELSGPGADDFTRMPAGTVMGHVHLHVDSIPDAEAFYVDVMGFDVMVNWDSATFLSYDGYHHHLGANVWAGRNHPPQDALGLDHLVIHYGDAATRDAILARYGSDENGIIRDASGNRIKLEA